MCLFEHNIMRYCLVCRFISVNLWLFYFVEVACCSVWINKLEGLCIFIELQMKIILFVLLSSCCVAYQSFIDFGLSHLKKMPPIPVTLLRIVYSICKFKYY